MYWDTNKRPKIPEPWCKEYKKYLLPRPRNNNYDYKDTESEDMQECDALSNKTEKLNKKNNQIEL